MNSGQLRVESAKLIAAAHTADETGDRLFERYHSVSVEMADALDGRWTGTAAQACQSAWGEWSDGFRLMVVGLRDEADALRISATEYTSVDDEGGANIKAAGETL